MKMKINITFILLGSIAIIAFILLIRFTWTLRDIRINGELRYCPIVEISYGRNDYATILIDGQRLDAGLLRTHKDVWGNRIDGLQIDDIISVRYIKGKSRVVQESVEPWRYYLFFGLESILGIMGIALTIGGFMGKTFYNSYIPKNIHKQNKYKPIGNKKQNKQ
jgi:hypothetical protein